jgi:hypothetical protein
VVKKLEDQDKNKKKQWSIKKETNPPHSQPQFEVGAADSHLRIDLGCL